MNNIIPTKNCSKCGELKPIETGFYPLKAGFTARCRDCIKSQSKRWAEDNPELKRAADAEKYQRYLATRELVPCSCGCGLMTKGKSKGLPYYPGHANKGKRHEPRSPGFPEGVLLDDEDRERFIEFSWSLSGNGYLQRHHVTETGRYTKKRLHQEIMGAPYGMTVDHINGNKLDNRRVNLRIVDQQANTQNRRPNSSGHRGVSWNKRSGKWYAHAKIDRKMISLGFYDNLEEAIRVADEFRRKHYRGYIDR